MNNVYCVCTTPEMYPHYHQHWDNFKDSGKEFLFISDNTKDKSFDIGFTFDENDLKTNLNFNTEPSTTNYWNCLGRRNIAWFYAHLRMLNFYISNPDYDYYWFFDDDIRMDNWSKFFDGVDKDDSDFLAYFCFKNKGVSSQPNIHTTDSRMFSNDQWFYRFPGHGAVMPNEVTEYFGSFFPTTRFSNRALKQLLTDNENQFHAYHEGFVPTMLNYHGMKLNTIIQPDNTSLLFDVNEVNIYHKNVKITWEWL